MSCLDGENIDIPTFLKQSTNAKYSVRERERDIEMEESGEALKATRVTETNLIEDDEDNITETVSAYESFDGEDNEVVLQRQLPDKLLPKLDTSEEAKREANLKTGPAPEKIETCSNEEIMKELKNLKNQNAITHSLLTVMIVLTLAWQLSEVSLILRIKDGLSNPFKSVAGMLRGFVKKPPREVNNNVQEIITNNASSSGRKQQKKFVQPTSLPELKIPELPILEFLGFDTSDED